MPSGLLGQKMRRMTYRGTEARIPLRLEPRNPPTHRVTISLGEALDRGEPHVTRAAPGEGDDRVAIAECVERFAGDEERRPLDVDDAARVIDLRVSRAADVDEQHNGERAPRGTDRRIQAIVHREPDASVDESADARGDVELLAITLAIESCATRA